jgi:tetratricopeptide (TPR) repeat protein
MLLHLSKGKPVFFILILLIIIVSPVAFAEDNKDSRETKGDAESFFSLGVNLGKAGKYEEAIEAYKQTIKLKPDFVDAYIHLGSAYGALDRHEEEIEAYKQLLRINPDDAKVYNQLGSAYGKSGKYEQAIGAYKQAIKLKPGFADAHYNLGVAYLQLEDTSSALLEEYVILKDLDKEKAKKLFNLIYP